MAPVPPRAGELAPTIETLAAGTRIVRIYDRAYAPLEFNPTAHSARFRPVRDAAGRVVPTAYGAFDDETAVAETILRGVSALRAGRARHRLYRAEVSGLDLVRLSTARELRLVRLHGLGLSRLGILREELIDCPETGYEFTARWAQALYGVSSRPHGLIWTSRQNDTAKAFMLWGGSRVRASWLVHDARPLRLDREPGLELIRGVSADAGVDFEG